MKISSLPLSIQKLCHTLRRGGLAVEEQARVVQAVVKHTVSFLGKLALLEYLQGNWKSPALNYQLFESSYPEHPRAWLRWIAAILDHFVHTGESLVLYPLLNLPNKYSVLQPERHDTADDCLSALLHFYDLMDHGSYLLSAEQIQEQQENIWSFLEELQFLDTSQYRLEERQTALIFSNNTLWLMPFFSAQLASEGTVLELDEDGDAALLKAYQLWLSGDFERYRQAKRAENGVRPLADTQRPYIMPPWLQAEWEECLQKTIMATKELEAGNVLLVEGYPASGKTALAQNLNQLVGNAGVPLSYFVIPHTPWQLCETFITWLTNTLSQLLEVAIGDHSEIEQDRLCQEKLTQQTKPFVVAIDGIEYMPAVECARLSAWVNKPPWSQLMFVLLKRLYEPCGVHGVCRMQLRGEDNVYFTQTFTPDYVQNLKRRYVNTPLAQKICNVLTQNNDSLSVRDIAVQVDAFTPDVMHTMRQMKPLCEVEHSFVQSEACREQIPCEKYRLFHPLLVTLLKQAK
jgi:hypothetical protein